jgi:hypothetical protein
MKLRVYVATSIKSDLQTDLVPFVYGMILRASHL